MKKLLFQLESVEKMITECEYEIEAVQSLPFYSVFKQESQRQDDLLQLNAHLKDFHNQKLSLLDQLQTTLKFERAASEQYAMAG
jgi:hypothetical protein